MCEVCLKLPITSELRDWRRSSIFIVNFDRISYLFLVSLLLTLRIYVFAGCDLYFFLATKCMLKIKTQCPRGFNYFCTYKEKIHSK